MAAKAPNLVFVALVLLGCVLGTILLVILGATLSLSFGTSRTALALELSVLLGFIVLIWTTFYRLTFIQSEIRDSDPRVYLMIKEPDGVTLKHTLVILKNHGGGVAHNVYIEPVTICRKQVEFTHVPVIATGESIESVPTVRDIEPGTPGRNDIFYWMEKDWSTYTGNITSEYSVPINVVYDDYTGTRHIRTAMMLIFYPLKYMHRRKEERSVSVEPLYEIRHIEFDLVDAKDRESNESAGAASNSS
ncbi:MAG: hypothetical protein WCC25_17675 [Candidatus Korobacteraceae bacterium]